MCFYLPTILQSKDGFLFLELAEIYEDSSDLSAPQLVWTNGNDLLFSFESIFRQLLYPQISIYPGLKIVAIEPVTNFRRSSIISISDFIVWLKDVNNVNFDSFRSMIDLYLENRNIDIKPKDYPLWLRKFQQQNFLFPRSSTMVLEQIQNFQFQEK